MDKVKITNSCQFERLVKEMEKNPSLSRGFGRGRLPNNFHEQWESIATILNSLGPPIRTGDGWRKVWSGLKSKVRRKIATNKAECKEAKLGPLDQAVANLLQFDRALNEESMVQGTPNIEDRAGCSSLQLNKSSTTISKTVVPSSASSISATSTSTSLSSAVPASSISATSTSTSLFSAESVSSITATLTSLSSAVSASSISATSTSTSLFSAESVSSITATLTSLSSAVSASSISATSTSTSSSSENIAEARRRRNIAKARLVTALGNVLAEIERSQQEDTDDTDDTE